MRFVASIYPAWDAAYARTLLRRFNLNEEQPIKGLSHGERVKATLLLALARRPRLLVLDEPTTGLDPVGRHEVLTELMDVLTDERRAILFSSHNTHDVEQISDQITFIDRGRIIDSSDKETFLERWRRIHLDVPAGVTLPALAGRDRHADERPPRDGDDQRIHPGSDAAYAQAGATRSRRAAHDARRDLRRHGDEQPEGGRGVTRSIVAQLALKDCYLARWIILGSIVAGGALSLPSCRSVTMPSMSAASRSSASWSC